ncbi:MAG: Crp/Fnr family transcriptional regulator [Bacteroidota bacterium]
MSPLASHIASRTAISGTHLELVLNKFDKKHYAKKEQLLHAGSYAKEVYFILKGCVRTYIHDLNGVEHNITFSMENWWFGDLQSFISRTPASFSIQALEETTVLSITKNHWDVLHQDVPAFLGYTRNLFRNTMFAHENRIVQNLSFTAEERYQYFLKNHPELAQRIPQKQVASYLGITPEFLSMLRHKLKN